MSSALRFLGNVRGNVSGKIILVKNNKISPGCRNLSVFNENIVARENQDESHKLLPPFDYKNKRYTWFHKKYPFLDPTKTRLNSNSKLITVEGNIGIKKEVFCKELAERFNFLYLPEPTLDDFYINHEGFDYRSLNQYITETLQAIDEKMYYENPKHGAVSWMKMYFYRIRYGQYIDALAHILNTGQGVVLERSPASEYVFTEAMYKTGIIDKECKFHISKL